MNAQQIFTPIKNMTFMTVHHDRTAFLNYCEHTQQQNIIIDLNSIEQCDSAGLSFLLEAKRICYNLGLNCQIINMPTLTTALAEFCGVKNLLLGMDVKSNDR